MRYVVNNVNNVNNVSACSCDVEGVFKNNSVSNVEVMVKETGLDL